MVTPVFAGIGTDTRGVHGSTALEERQLAMWVGDRFLGGGHIKMADTSGSHDHCLKQQALWAQPAAGPSSQPHECRGGPGADAPGVEPCLPACTVGE